MCIFELDFPEFNTGPVSWVALEKLQSFSLSISCQICEMDPIFFHRLMRGLNTKRAMQHKVLVQLFPSFKHTSIPFFALDGALCKKI